MFTATLTPIAIAECDCYDVNAIVGSVNVLFILQIAATCRSLYLWKCDFGYSFTCLLSSIQ